MVDEQIVGLDLASLDVEPVAGILWQKLTWRGAKFCPLPRSTQQIFGPQDYEKLLAEAAQVPSEDLRTIQSAFSHASLDTRFTI